MGIKSAKVSPSIIATNYLSDEALKNALVAIEKAGAKMVHIDVMDGKFVKNKTFDHKFVDKVKDMTSLLLDVHLMVKDVDDVIDDYINAGAEILTVHFEACENVKKVLKHIKSKNVVAGIAIKPNTEINEVKNLIKSGLVDLVLVMSVEPGACGQAYIDGSEQKIAQIKSINKKVMVEVDGGINAENAKLIRGAGADILVSGSAIFKSDNMKKTIKKLRGGLFS